MTSIGKELRPWRKSSKREIQLAMVPCGRHKKRKSPRSIFFFLARTNQERVAIVHSNFFVRDIQNTASALDANMWCFAVQIVRTHDDVPMFLLAILKKSLTTPIYSMYSSYGLICSTLDAWDGLCWTYDRPCI